MQREGIFSWAITTRQVSGDLWLSRPSPVIAHWVVYQQKKKPSELGVSLPSNMGQDGHEKAPHVWLNSWPQGGPVNYILALAKRIAKDWTRAFATCLCGDWTLHSGSCWPSTPAESRSEVVCAPRNLVDRSLDSWILFFFFLRNRFYNPNPCTSSCLEKH